MKVRLAEIDCPGQGQPYNRRAELFARGLCLGKMVTVWPATFDRSGQAWAHVMLPDGRCLNEELVRAGLAWQDSRYSQRADLAAMQKEARRAKRGLWSQENPQAPWQGR
ncbi:MAG: thermonuclease family protein [Proteobacteria bacterium]|nr:thermonuclease family protein [Pseudomonadota bacterium]MBU4597190.1 thermonuclease family protein [Pseudomonadota bacterium]